MANSLSPPRSSFQLPPAVLDQLHLICRAQGLPWPDFAAQCALASLGEDTAISVLQQISARSVRNLSGFIVHMARKAEADVAARNALPLQTQESACFSYSSSAVHQLDEDDEGTSLLSAAAEPSRPLVPCGNGLSPQLVALGELEFRKAFLILSYIGRTKLEDALTVDMIRNLKDLHMSHFERQVWSHIGCISDSDRRKNLDWDSQKTHVYYCYVDSDGNCSFKGPDLQPKRTHLQKVLGDDNVLVVKFSEGDSEMFQKDVGRNIAYTRIALEGVFVGLRRYKFFVFKDGGKEEKKKNPTSSPVKCYFVRTESGWSRDREQPYILSNKTIHEARSIFMHVHTVSSLPKYMARFSLILSKTLKLDVDFSSVSIERIPDIPCKDEQGRVVYNEDGEQLIHTDGTGFISEDLALKCPGYIFKGAVIPKYVQDIQNGFEKFEKSLSLLDSRSTKVPPLLIQFRLFNNGCAAKGTLLVDRRLPPNTIYIRPSMIKVEADPMAPCLEACNSLEIVTTSNQPKRTYLSKSLIALLHYGGVPKQCILDLLELALDDVQNARYSKKVAMRVALNHGEMTDFLEARMICSGIPLDEPYLQYRLSILMKEEKKGLMGGKIPVSDSYHLMGTADPTGTLRPDEVCVILENGHLSGDVLVYKHPGLHFGDIHILKATYVPELENIIGRSKYAIFFPVNGPRSLADEMANSDFDGDMYWVSRNAQLLQYFKVSKPWVQSHRVEKNAQPKPTDFPPNELESQLFQLFLEARFNPSYCMALASDCWMTYMDRLLTLPDDCFKEKCILQRKLFRLVDIYYHALDSSKTGIKVEVPADLRAEKYPHFLNKTNAYHSRSILGAIYDRVTQFKDNVHVQEEIWQLLLLNDEIHPSFIKLWESRYAEYREEMHKALQSDDKELKNHMASIVIQKYKRMLYEADEFEDSKKDRGHIFKEALAIYQISYAYAKDNNDVGKCSFAWNVAGHALVELYANKQGGPRIVCAKGVLQELYG